jgi:hypothetical protein
MGFDIPVVVAITYRYSFLSLWGMLLTIILKLLRAGKQSWRLRGNLAGCPTSISHGARSMVVTIEEVVNRRWSQTSLELSITDTSS